MCDFLLTAGKNTSWDEYFSKPDQLTNKQAH